MTSPTPEVVVAELLDHDTTVLDEEGNKILSGLRDVVLDPAAIDVLYTANPLLLTKAQRAVVVESLRRHRAERTAKKAARVTKKKLTDDEKNKLSLDDLGELEI